MEITAEEKAKELFSKMKKHTECKCFSFDDDNAKESALVAVDEILNSGLLEPQLKRHYLQGVEPKPMHLEYWQKVKNKLHRI